METLAIKELIEANKEDFLKDLRKVMQVKSVKSDAEPGKPFGSGPREALEVVMALAKSYGFDVGIVDDAVGYVQCGNGSEYVGVVGHLDVVPEGNDWDYPPFDLTAANEKFYGRGILDNKGPIFACLYGLKLLKDSQADFKRTIRIVVGTDEESGSSDLPLYLAKEKPPVFGFTPDCKYPVVYGERGIVNYELRTNFSADAINKLGAIEGDQFKDHVPDQLTIKLADTEIKVQGKRSPTNAPELGLNGITLLAEKLMNSELDSSLTDYFTWLYESLHEKHYGEGLGIDFEDEDSGKLIITPYELQKEGNQMVLRLAIRYPVTFTEEDVYKNLITHLPDNSEMTVIRRIKGHMISKDRAGIKVLSEVYGEVSGLDATPVTTTGATYARFMPNIVAFGPSFPGQKGIAHNKNEYMDQVDLFKNMEIYMQAMLALANAEEI